MSEGDVSLIRDEDLLRRMWQQTEDFSRKKEIRAHMYRLREERLRNLYSPEPTASDGKDLKELSNAGWDVESENRTSDDGHTRIKAVHANIEGRYDVDGGRGQFAAVDHHKQAVTEYQDDHSSLKRNETSSSTAAHEQVVRNTDDGAHFSSTTSTSSTSKYEQMSTKHVNEPVTYNLRDDNDKSINVSRNETRTNNEQNIRNEYNSSSDRRTNYDISSNERTVKNEFDGTLVARKVEYPDDNTRIIVETRCLPDGTRVTSTKREFRAPIQSTTSQQRSQTKVESKYTQNRKDDHSTFSQQTQRENDIVDSQKYVDDYDFKKQILNYRDNDEVSETSSVRNVQTDIKKSNYSTLDRETRTKQVTDNQVDSSVQTTSSVYKVVDNNDQKDTQRVTKINQISIANTDDNINTYSDKISGDPQSYYREPVTKVHEFNINDSDQKTHVTRVQKFTESTNNDDVQRQEKIKIIHKTDIDDSSQTNYQKKNILYTEKVVDNDYYPNRCIHVGESDDIPDGTLNRKDKTFNKNDDIKYNNKERIQKVTKDRKTEEVVERKISNEYQTTYQTDYQKKISTDWSPSHQAWASTLRSDTPSTARPSTRASSPGSKTFKSSTSSLRSSVSPDKNSRKPSSRPSSRGGSPSKSDRHSPIRNIEKHSSSRSTYSSTETKTTRRTSPEGRPPTGRSPSLSNSPDRKLTKDNRDRTSSPEKLSQNVHRTITPSPERKPKEKLNNQSVPDLSNRTSSPLKNSSPDRNPDAKQEISTLKQSSHTKEFQEHRNTEKNYNYHSIDQHTTDKRPRESTPTTPYTEKRSGTSPDRKPQHTRISPDRKPNTQSFPLPNRSEDAVPNKREGDSPHKTPDSVSNKIPGYMQPTASRKPNVDQSPTDDFNSNSKLPPRIHDNSYQRQDITRITKAREDHYKFVDEETKMYSHKLKNTDNYTKTAAVNISYDKTTTHQVPGEDCPDNIPSKKLSEIKNVKDDFIKHTTSNNRVPKSRENSPTKLDAQDKLIHENSSKHTRELSPSKVKLVEKSDNTKKPNETITNKSDSHSRSLSPIKNIPKDVENSLPKLKSPRQLSPSKMITKKDLNNSDDKLLKHSDSKSRTPSPSKQLRERSPTRPTVFDNAQKSKDKLQKDTTSFKPELKDLKPEDITQNLDSKEDLKTGLRSPSPTKKLAVDSSKPKPSRTPSPMKVSNVKASPERSEILQSKENIDKEPHNQKIPGNSQQGKDSLGSRETSPTKFGTYDKKKVVKLQELTITDDTQTTETTTKISASPSSPDKNKPRASVSPNKSPVKDLKYKHTTDFLNSERMSEKINKTATNQHPRKLITPSSSPTRKPKSEVEPSTGQSSPTTSTDFVYFESPKPQKPIITDIETQEFSTETILDEKELILTKTDNMKDIKLPCRSPSPEKRPKDSLPRKSSLKKPITGIEQRSPIEEPPSSFKISPDDDSNQKQPSQVKPYSTELQQKPPFERRETYEDRCRKILGMTEDKNDSTSNDIINYPKKVDSDIHSPFSSPSADTSFDFTNTKSDKTIVSDFTNIETLTKDSNCSTEPTNKLELRTRSPTKYKETTTVTSDRYDVTTEDFSKHSDTKTTISQSLNETIEKYPESVYTKDNTMNDTKDSTRKYKTQIQEKKSKQSTIPTRQNPEHGYDKLLPKRDSPVLDDNYPQDRHQKVTITTTSDLDTQLHSEDSIVTINKLEKHSESTIVNEQIKDDKKPRYLDNSKSLDTVSEKMPSKRTSQQPYKETTINTTNIDNVTEHPNKYSQKDHILRETSPVRKPGIASPREDNLNTSTKHYLKDSSPTRNLMTPESQTFNKLIISKNDTNIINVEKTKAIKQTKVQGSQIPKETSPTKYDQEVTSNKNDNQQKHTEVSTTVTSKNNTVTIDSTEKHVSAVKLQGQRPKTISPLQPKTRDQTSSSKKSTNVIIFKDDITDEDNEHLSNRSVDVEDYKSPRSSVSPSRHVSQPSNVKFEEPRSLRTPSPTKKTIAVSEVNTDFIICEQEHEVVNQAKKSLIKLSPEHRERDPSPQKNKITNLPELNSTECVLIEDHLDTVRKHVTQKEVLTVDETHSKEKPKEHKPSNKLSSRTVSPTKKPGGTISKVDKVSEQPKSRSISPKKSISERPESPKVPKSSGIKPREPVPTHLTRRPVISSTLVERTTTDLNKSTGVSKQNTVIIKNTVKTTANRFISSKNEPEMKKSTTSNSVMKNDTKVTRAASDTAMKTKKPAPQRMKSKPEIHISDMTTKLKFHKPKESQSKLPKKPKSATTLNSSTDDDIIIDVQQSKSSRENSPDRICPTPINFDEETGAPRFPDDVHEPDDDLRKRTYNTIHEVETIVDDIVEIREDDELFVRRSDMDEKEEHNENLLIINSEKYKNKTTSDAVKSKDVTKVFKNIERQVHSDFTNEETVSDECLLSVSEKVNKFAKGPKDTKERKSPCRKITDEYDRNTNFQDDYTKLSVNDKANLFVETAENINSVKVKPSQKPERPNLSNVEDYLKKDDCLLSVSDKVNKFVKTAEQFFTETQEDHEREIKIKEEHDRLMSKIVIDSENDDTEQIENNIVKEKLHKKTPERQLHKQDTYTIEPAHPLQTNDPKYLNKPKSTGNSTEKTPVVKITTLRSSEAVKKAKALFENIATTQQKSATKLTDIGIIKRSKNESSSTSHPAVTKIPNEQDMEVFDHNKNYPTSGVLHKPKQDENKPRSSPSRFSTDRLVSESLSPDFTEPDLRPKSPSHKFEHSKSPPRTTTAVPRQKSPSRTLETPTKPISSKSPSTQSAESPKKHPEDKVPGYLKPTKTSQMKEEKTEEVEVSSRRGSGKFGVELRKTSLERSTPGNERRRSVEHPCIEDIYDLDLLEQMLEKVTGYEQRRRIRAQIRIAKKSEHVDTMTITKITKSVPKTKTPERQQQRSPDRTPTAPEKPISERASSPQKLKETKEYTIITKTHKDSNIEDTRESKRLASSEKPASKSTTKSPRQLSPEKKRTQSPTKVNIKPKTNKFNEYASAYMKKVGLSDAEKLKTSEAKNKVEMHGKIVRNVDEYSTVEHISSSQTRIERISTIDETEAHVNGKRPTSPGKRLSPEKKLKEASTEKLRRATTPESHTKSETGKKETIIKTVYDLEKKMPQKQVQEEKPSWITNRNLKKITSDTRTFSSKKIDSEKPKHRAASPSKVISKPIDVITSSYGPGPLDADGKPLFGIKALRNGGSNFQVKGTVVRQEFHSRNGGEPEGTVSVTAYSTEPEELERLLKGQAPPSRIHGLAAITTTTKFGGDTGTTLREVHSREDKASLDQFTHSDRRVIDSKIDTLEESGAYDSTEHISGNTRRIETRREEIIEEFAPVTSEETILGRADKGRKGNMDAVHKTVRREDKQTARQSSVKSLTEKYVKSASEASKTERTVYPKAGLILRTATMKDSISSDSSVHAGLTRTDSEHSIGSVDDTVVTTTTEKLGDGIRTTTTTRTVHHGHVHHVQPKEREEKSFLNSSTKVTGVQDILTRMKNADIVIQEGDTSEDAEARALLNKFLGATVLMSGMQGYVTEKPSGKVVIKQETVRSGSGSGGKVTTARQVEEIDIDQCWDDRLLKKLLDESSDYEERRRLRARIRTLMAEQEACASAVTEALNAAGESTDGADGTEAREEEEVTVTSSMRRDSSEKTVSSSTTTKTSKVIESMTRPAPKPVSPFAKFRQLEKQNSTNSPNSAKTPQSPGSPSQPLFKFTDPALQASALTIKERLLQWCRDKTRDYENVKLENFSTSWADGLAFCALVHHFLPDAFDYSQLTADKRRHNFTLAFTIADEKAGIYPLLDVDDMVKMRKPDWKCVFTYVQAIHRRFKDQD